MSFLQRRHSVKEKAERETKRWSKPLPLIPSSAAVENVPQKWKRTRTASTMGAGLLMRRVSSIFTPRKKPRPDLKLVNQALRRDARRPSYSSSTDSLASEDDIRVPSGLGSAVSNFSNQSLPPSPFYPPPPAEPPAFPDGQYQRTRAKSTPNLFRSWSQRAKEKVRRGSISRTPVRVAESPMKVQPERERQLPPLPPSPPAPPSRKYPLHLPEEIISLILSHLPSATVSLCATVSRNFSLSALCSLYTTLDIDTLSPLQLEKLVTLLVLRRDLLDLVTSFICRQWPHFFLPDRQGRQNDAGIGYIIQEKDALLTASFTLALERMSNLISLTLPSFNFSVLSHHSAFGLKSLTFLNGMTTDEETKALFAWLDGQTNIVSLRFPNIEDSYGRPKWGLSINTDVNKYERTRAKTAPSSPYRLPFPTTSLSPLASPLSSPRSADSSPPCSTRSPTPAAPTAVQFASKTLLPNLTTLHATPSLAMLLASPLETGLRRPLKSVSLNINNTLYNGLRPAALMGSFLGISHLALRFGEDVDRRSYEKVLGAAGAALGAPAKEALDTSADDDPFLDTKYSKTVATGEEWQGLRSLEVTFSVESASTQGRNEVGDSTLLFIEFVLK